MGRSMTTLGLSVLGLSLLAGQANAADICEPLREQIEMQIAATGATGFAVVVVDADAEVAGKLVGTCAKGARKLVYVRAGEGSAVGARAAPRPARPTVTAQAPQSKKGQVITECRDGTVVQGNAGCKP